MTLSEVEALLESLPDLVMPRTLGRAMNPSGTLLRPKDHELLRKCGVARHPIKMNLPNNQRIAPLIIRYHDKYMALNTKKKLLSEAERLGTV